MSLRDRVAAEDQAFRRPHAVERFINSLTEPSQRDEVMELIADRSIHASSLSRAIRAEYGIALSDERIREWRRDHVTEGPSPVS